MNSQSGWPVYVLLGTLSLLCLIGVRTMQPSPSVKLKESDKWVHVDSIRPPKVALGPPTPFTAADSRSPWNDSWSNQNRGATRQELFPSSGKDLAAPAAILPVRTRESMTGGHTTARVVGQVAEAAHDAHVRALPPTIEWDALTARVARLRTTIDRAQDGWPTRLRQGLTDLGKSREAAEVWLATRVQRNEEIIVQRPELRVHAPKPQSPWLVASALRNIPAYSETLWADWSARWQERSRHMRQIPSRLASFPRSAAAQSSGEARAEAPAQVVKPTFEIRATRPATWPYAEHLARRIDALPKSDMIENWVETTQQEIDRLSHYEHLDAEGVEEQLLALQDQLEQLDALLAAMPGNEDPYELRAVKYDLQKWITIWTLVHHAQRYEFVATSPGSTASVSIIPVANARPTDLVLAIDAVDRQLRQYVNRDAWREFLELDALRAWAESDYVHSASSASIDRVLTRTEMARLSQSQRSLLERPEFRQFQSTLRRYSEPNVSLSELLYLLEVYEQKPWELVGTKVLASSRRLSRSENPYLKKLSQLLEVHYRNANVRLAISEKLLNQLVPASQAMAEPVSDQVMGARVFGASHTTNQLSVETVPDLRHVHLRLRANGTVASSTRATKGLFVFHNRGLGHFTAQKDIRVSPETLRVDPTLVTASNQNRTLGVESDLDLFPLIGPLARSFAMQKQSEAAPLTRRIVEKKLASKAQQRIDAEVDVKLDEAEANLKAKLFNPLDDLSLALEPVDFSTTESRAIMRYRLAGSEQLSAFTSRPRAYANSVMSLQLHQSAVNNCLQRLDLAGKEFRIDELYAHMSKVLGRDIPTPEDMDPSVVLRFAPSDCIEVRFTDGTARLYLRFAELAIGRASRWRNLTIEAEYEPRIDGIHIDFVRVPESTLALQGRNIGFRDQMAIRTIFNKVFDPNLSLGVTPKHLLTDARFENLEVSQFELRDGWVGLSVEAQ